MLKKYVLTAAAAAAFAPFALAQMRDMPPQQGQQPSAQHEPDKQEMQRDFFRESASDNTLEIRLGKLAQQRSNNDEIKHAAQMLVDDHTQANQLLKQIADRNHIEVNTDELDPVGQAMLQAMEKKQGEAFEHAFLFGMIGDHAKAVLVMRYHAEKATDPVCREYAAQVLPKMREHLAMLERIAAPMVGETAGGNLLDEARPAGERINGQSNQGTVTPPMNRQ